jgi:hypothetical protein
MSYRAYAHPDALGDVLGCIPHGVVNNAWREGMKTADGMIGSRRLPRDSSFRTLLELAHESGARGRLQPRALQTH